MRMSVAGEDFQGPWAGGLSLWTWVPCPLASLQEPGPGVLSPWQVRWLFSLPSYGTATNKARPAWHPELGF